MKIKIPILVAPGLGLFVSKLIIERHQGKIIIESTKDLGSEFIISLPL